MRKTKTNRSKRMKILMITPYLPYPPYSGGQTRSYNLIKRLARKCEITLFSFILPDQKPTQVNHMKKYCRKVFAIERGKTWSLKKILFTGLSPYPFLISNYFSLQLKRMIAKELAREKYDLVHVECFYLMPNIPRTKVPVILVDQTIEFAVYQHFVDTLPRKRFFLKPWLWLDVAKIKYWETSFWKKADYLVAVSKNDQELMARLSQRPVGVVLNGVDDSLIKPKSVKKYARPTMLYGVANYKWMQNKEGAINLLKYVWPKVKKAIPNAQLHIAGRHSASFLKNKQKLIAFPESVRIGEVDNPELAYRRSWALVAPMGSGGGSRTKFFEAMAYQLPVVTTSEGIEGIEATNNHNVLINNNLNQLAKTTIRLLRDKKLREEIGKNGQELVKEKYSWRISADRLLDIYQKMTDQKQKL